MITFSAVEAFFRAVNDQSWLFEARGADFWEEIGQNGSADADPKFYCIFGMGTAASQLALTCKSRSVTITRSFMPGDILIIDSDNKIINHN